MVARPSQPLEPYVLLHALTFPLMGPHNAISVLSTIVDNTDIALCGPINGKVRACNSTYGSNGWLGLATIWLTSGTKHIYQGTAKVNDTYFNTSTYNSPVAKRHVLCQEIGHTFGLGHIKNQASCMNDLFGLFSTAYQSPNKHDYDQLASIYAHLDPPSSPAGTGNGRGNGAADNEPTDALPPGAGPEHGDIFERDLGNGRTMITVVTWVQSGAAGQR